MRAFLFSLIHALVTRHPRLVSILSVVLAAVAGIYGTFKMEMITDQDRLLSENLPYHHRYMNFVRNFGDLEFIYILIEGPTQERMVAFADALAARLDETRADTGSTRDRLRAALLPGVAAGQRAGKLS